MVTIKSSMDGDRMVLLIENCTGDLRKKVQKLLLELFEVGDIKDNISDIEPVKTTNDMPDYEKYKNTKVEDIYKPLTEEEFNRILISSGDYKGYKIGEAVQKYGIKPIISVICDINNIIAAEYKNDCLKYCKKILSDNIKNENNFENFLKLYGCFLKKEIDKVTDENGVETIWDFIQVMSPDSHQEVFDKLKTGLLKRLNK